MTKRKIALGLVALAVVAVAARLGVSLLRWAELGQILSAGDTAAPRPARIRPDYTDLVIPPNIAPLNFTILERGTRYWVRACALESGVWAEVLSGSPDIRFPSGPWRGVLEDAQACASPVLIDVAVRGENGRWQWYAPITNRVASEPIDPYLVNRIIPPLYNYWGEIEIRQRNLESFEERTVVHSRAAADACLNCHSFRANHTDRMTLGIRSGKVGSSTVMVRDGGAEKVGTKFGYTAWHPSGQLVAYSANEVRQFFHTARAEVRDVVDLDSAIAYFDLRTQTAKTAPGLNDDNRLETYPTWSSDGKYLYFCSAPFPSEDRSKVPPDNYQQCRYDLRRISYEAASDTWGEPETVLSSAETGKSILLPRISPDDRFLLCCLCDYGCFPIYQPSSDLYMLDLKTGKHWRLAINSPLSESWHSWSSNGRWIAFSSKRRDGLFTRTYLSYVDASGKAHKPFIVPQKDPSVYDSYLKTYTVPELIAEPVRVRPQRLANVILNPEELKVESPVSFKRVKPAGGAASDAPWTSGRR